MLACSSSRLLLRINSRLVGDEPSSADSNAYPPLLLLYTPDPRTSPAPIQIRIQKLRRWVIDRHKARRIGHGYMNVVVEPLGANRVCIITRMQSPRAPFLDYTPLEFGDLTPSAVRSACPCSLGAFRSRGALVWHPWRLVVGCRRGFRNPLIGTGART